MKLIRYGDTDLGKVAWEIAEFLKHQAYNIKYFYGIGLCYDFKTPLMEKFRIELILPVEHSPDDEIIISQHGKPILKITFRTINDFSEKALFISLGEVIKDDHAIKINRYIIKYNGLVELADDGPWCEHEDIERLLKEKEQNT